MKEVDTMKSHEEVYEFRGRKESINWRKDNKGNIWMCPASAKDLSECVSEDIVDLTYSRGG
jgi:hypothetical protein